MNVYASAEPIAPATPSPRRLAWFATLAIFVATWIQPKWPLEQALHGSLTVVAFALLAWYGRRSWARDRDFLLLCGFLALHCIASRWLYSNVPYDEWSQQWLGVSPQSLFGWQRNHFDRLVHLAYGICFTPALVCGLRARYPAMSPRWAFALAVLLIMGSSLAYEWLEWAIALTMSPEQAEAYNGQQGDMWDAHADMLLATLGSAAHGFWILRRHGVGEI